MGGRGNLRGKRLHPLAAVMLPLTAFSCATSSEIDAAADPGEAAPAGNVGDAHALQRPNALGTLTPATVDANLELHAAPETALDLEAWHVAESNTPIAAAAPILTATQPATVAHNEPTESAPTQDETPTPVQAAQPTAAVKPLELPKLNPAAGQCEVGAFVGLGEGTQASSASADGAVVVGSANGHAFRWTTSFCLQTFSGFDVATNVSPNGLRITGAASGIAVVWNDTSNSGDVVSELGSLPYQMISGRVVLDDGKLYGTCRSLHLPRVDVACVSDGSSVNFLRATTVNAADATGAFAGIATHWHTSDPRSPAALSGEVLSLPSSCMAPIGCSAELQAFNTEHSVAVGTALLTLPSADLTMPVSTSPLFDTAVIYTPATLLQRLDDLPGGDVGAGAYAVSADGRIIGGFASDELGRRAALWIDRQPRALADVLGELGVELPSGWVLSVVRAISSDARVLIGNGIDPNGQPQAFRIVLPSSL